MLSFLLCNNQAGIKVQNTDQTDFFGTKYFLHLPAVKNYNQEYG